jgi:hypothetical protein
VEVQTKSGYPNDPWEGSAWERDLHVEFIPKAPRSMPYGINQFRPGPGAVHGRPELGCPFHSFEVESKVFPEFKHRTALAVPLGCPMQMVYGKGKTLAGGSRLGLTPSEGLIKASEEKRVAQYAPSDHYP